MCIKKMSFFLLVLTGLCALSIFAANRQPKSLRETLASQQPARQHPSTLAASGLPVMKAIQADSLSTGNYLSPNRSRSGTSLFPLRANTEIPTGSEERKAKPAESIFIPHPSSLILSLDQGADSCPAFIIPGTPFEDSGTTHGLSDNFAPSCSHGSPNSDAIYEFTPQTTGTYILTTYSGTSNRIFALRSGGPCPGNVEMMCYQMMFHSIVSCEFQAGVHYYIIIDQASSSEQGGDYRIGLSGPIVCNPAFNLVAPGTVSGNTCFGNDNCPQVPGEDQVVRVVIPQSGRWQFSLCDDQNWVAAIYLRTGCCDSTIVSDYWGGNCPGQGRPIVSHDLEAGEYFLDIEGSSYDWDQCGPWTLTVSQLPDLPPPPTDNCTDVVPVSLPAVFIGDNTGATSDCPDLSFYGNDVWHTFVLDSPADVIVDYCGTSAGITQVISILVYGCPCDSSIYSYYYDYQPCGNENVIRILFPNLSPGTYYIPVVGNDISNHGSYTIHVYSPPSCIVQSGANDVVECPETPDSTNLSQDCNGGCNVTPPAYQEISLTDTVFGRCFTYIGTHWWNQYRDTDWYRFTLSDTADVTVSLTAEFPAACMVLDNRNCEQGRYCGGTSSLDRCQTLSFTSDCLPPGIYNVFVAPSIYEGIPEPKNYRMSFTTSSCGLCQITMQPGDVSEGEPDCYTEYNDVTNGGCEYWPEIYGEITVGETVYGNSGVYRHSWDPPDSSWFRDTDWYRFELPEHAMLIWTFEADYPAWTFLAEACDDEEWGELAGADVPPCHAETLRTQTCIPPGTYYIYVSTPNWGPYPCGSHYRGTLTTAPCSECDTSLVRLYDVIEQEPICNYWYVDSVNGGCNSTPPIFGQSLACGQTIVGTSGTFWGNWTESRDTDWFPITIPSPRTVVLRWCVFAQFPPMITILRVGNCDSLAMMGGIATGNSCDTVCTTDALAPGNYWLFVAPNDFRLTPCSAQYIAWTTCQPCTPDTVQNVTLRRIGNSITLRWSTDAGFVGTYDVYTSSDLNTWSLLQSNIAPVFINNGNTFTDTTTFASYKAYLITSTCP
jgi:hypothetical protein